MLAAGVDRDTRVNDKITLSIKAASDDERYHSDLKQQMGEDTYHAKISGIKKELHEEHYVQA